MTTRLIALLAVAALAAAGCGGAETSAPTDATEIPVETVQERTATPEPATDEPATPTEEEILEASEEYTQDLTWESNGVTVTINSLWLLPVEAAGEEILWMLDDEDTQTIIGLEVELTNNTTNTLSMYLEYGTLVIGPDQYEGGFLATFSGDQIREGVTTTGDVIFESTRTVDELAAVGEARYIASAGWDDDTFEEITDELDVVLKW